MSSSALPGALIQQVATLSRQQKLRLVEHVARALASEESQEEHEIFGALADQGDLLDEIAEDALAARERDPLRRSGA